MLSGGFLLGILPKHVLLCIHPQRLRQNSWRRSQHFYLFHLFNRVFRFFLRNQVMQLRHFYFISDFPIFNTLPNQRKRRLRNQTLVLRHSPWSCEVSKVLRELADDRWRRLVAWCLYLAERVLQQQVEIVGFPLFIIHISRLVHRHSSVAIVEQMRI